MHCEVEITSLACSLNPRIYKLAASTNVLETWRKHGFIPPSEIEEYKQKWLAFRSLHLRVEGTKLDYPDGNTGC